MTGRVSDEVTRAATVARKLVAAGELDAALGEAVAALLTQRATRLSIIVNLQQQAMVAGDDWLALTRALLRLGDDVMGCKLAVTQNTFTFCQWCATVVAYKRVTRNAGVTAQEGRVTTAWWYHGSPRPWRQDPHPHLVR